MFLLFETLKFLNLCFCRGADVAANDGTDSSSSSSSSSDTSDDDDDDDADNNADAPQVLEQPLCAEDGADDFDFLFDD